MKDSSEETREEVELIMQLCNQFLDKSVRSENKKEMEEIRDHWVPKIIDFISKADDAEEVETVLSPAKTIFKELLPQKGVSLTHNFIEQFLENDKVNNLEFSPISLQDPSEYFNTVIKLIYDVFSLVVLTVLSILLTTCRTMRYPSKVNMEG